MNAEAPSPTAARSHGETVTSCNAKLRGVAREYEFSGRQPPKSLTAQAIFLSQCGRIPSRGNASRDSPLVDAFPARASNDFRGSNIGRPDACRGIEHVLRNDFYVEVAEGRRRACRLSTAPAAEKAAGDSRHPAATSDVVLTNSLRAEPTQYPEHL